MQIRTGLQVLVLSLVSALSAQVDPGLRGGPPGAGQPLPGLNPGDRQAFARAQGVFEEITTVAGGLGPRFNGDSCAGCHAHPNSGGSSPALNPQYIMATRMGAINAMPGFLQEDGPVRIARQVFTPDGEPDGGVLNLFTVKGRSDAAGCEIKAADFSNTANLRFRIPTPVYGLGLIEAITDATLRDNLASTAAPRAQFGIRGRFNTSGNDGTIMRYGWKAQNKSILMFAGEAYHVEQGVTNELFPNPRDQAPRCGPQVYPEDHSAPDGTPSDIQLFAQFMRLLDQPRPAPPPQSNAGRQAYIDTGCALCHTPVLLTGNAVNPALSNRPVNIFSDLALHDMGATLGDGISQGNATGNEFRTAPLWGLGQRVFLLHDGRTKDLVEAIRMHAGPGSEANQSIRAFEALSTDRKQALIDFLRSL